MNRCLFLDRDGIINRDIGYVYKPEEFEFLPGIFELCRASLQNSFLIVIVTNQSGVARGFYTEEDLQRLNHWLKQKFQQQNIEITAIYHCPHHPDITGPCECRKPEPGMILQAIRQYQIDPQTSIMVGDKESDMIAADRAKIPTRILLQSEPATQSAAATQHVRTLDEITQYIMSQ